jgi:membrane fusion protein (multidrug efflux system)
MYQLPQLFLAVPFILSSLIAQEERQDLEREIERSTRELQTQIQEARKQLQTSMGEYPDEERIHVILVPLERAILSNQISTPILSSQVSAPVKKIHKRMGEKFKKGDVLIEMDNEIFRANIDKAESVLSRAKAGLTARTQLYRDNISSFLELKEAQALAASAEAELVLARTQLEGATIKAPFNGKVVTLAIEEFELPQPGQALIEIVNDEILLARALVPSLALPNLHIGKVLKVHIRETNTEVNAKITRIGAVIDPSSGTIAIDAEIDNRDGHLRAGMTGTTVIPKENR